MRYTIGSVISDWEQYEAMCASFFAAGFTPDLCQYVALDNRQQNYCLYSGYNKIISQAQSEFIILVHQDVRADFDDEKVLHDRLSALQKVDPQWAVVGNAGATNTNEWIVRITDRYGQDQNLGHFPAQVQTLDGNLLILKRESLVGFSADLQGFHYYGWDVCLHASLRGFTCYVIDWHVAHLGQGNVNEHFYTCQNAFISKWKKAFAPRKLGAFTHDIIQL